MNSMNRTNFINNMTPFVYCDPQMGKLIKIADNIANSKANILITGESGTGKDLLAKYIHSKSLRKNKKLYSVNCAALPEGLLESELFGYEKGAFTDAVCSKPGKLELAEGSTFLFDEISEMSVNLQAKLLRVLQENEIERLGAKSSKKINVRFIAISNKNLKQMIENQTFRNDLYFRFNVINLHIPPLRTRLKDIVVLTDFFIQQSLKNNNLGENKKLSTLALQKMLQYQWPGNVRELQNVIERSVILSANTIINEKDIVLSEIDSLDNMNCLSYQPGTKLKDVEKKTILDTLFFANYNRTKTAEILGISIRTLRNKLNEYKLQGDL